MSVWTSRGDGSTHNRLLPPIRGAKVQLSKPADGPTGRPSPRKLSRRSEETGEMVLKTADSASVPLSGGAPTEGRGDGEGRGPVGWVSSAPFGKEWVADAVLLLAGCGGDGKECTTDRSEGFSSHRGFSFM